MSLLRPCLFGLAMFTLLACNRERIISETDARTFASKALARYCQSEKLSPQHFNLASVGPVADSQWTFVYVSSGVTPKHKVVIEIDRTGNLNVSRDIGNEDD